MGFIQKVALSSKYRAWESSHNGSRLCPLTLFDSLSVCGLSHSFHQPYFQWNNISLLYPIDWIIMIKHVQIIRTYCWKGGRKNCSTNISTSIIPVNMKLMWQKLPLKWTQPTCLVLKHWVFLGLSNSTSLLWLYDQPNLLCQYDKSIYVIHLNV